MTENLWLYIDEENESWGPFTDDERADIDCTSTKDAGPVPLGEGRERLRPSPSGGLVEPGTICEWFLLCANEAEKELDHPVLGQVPICHRCRVTIGDAE